MCSQKSRLSCCVHTINKSSLHLSSLELKIPFSYYKFCPYVGERYITVVAQKKKSKLIVIIISSIFRMILTCSISVARFRKRIVLSFLTSTLRAAVAPQVEFPTCCACFFFRLIVTPQEDSIGQALYGSHFVCLHQHEMGSERLSSR